MTADVGDPVRSHNIHLRYSLLLLVLVLVANAAPFLNYRSGDADFYLIPWYQHILAVGRLQAFAEPFSNYSPPLPLSPERGVIPRSLD